MTNSYVELHCHSNFSLLDGASYPEALLDRAAELGMPALALTDHDAMYGAVRFSKAANERGIHPMFGTELTLESGHHLTLLVENATGWSNLCQLITFARHNAPKGEAELLNEALEGHTAGLLALSGCRKGEVAAALRRGDAKEALEAAQRYQALFGSDHFYLELQHHRLPADTALVDDLVALADQINAPYVATNNVHYVTREGQPLQDVLVCIRHHATLDQAAHLCRPNSEYYLKSAEEMRVQFDAYPAALTNTLLIAEQCQFELAFGLQALPTFPTPERKSAHEYLTSLCRTGFYNRRIEPSIRVLNQLEHELAVIERSNLSNYFLVVWDIVRFANDNCILCQGRGSAANSLVAYLLGISPINPLEHNLVFERFLSDERQVVPDIDIDFQASRREECLQYVYSRYGISHAAMACTFVTFRAKSAFRDIGKTFGLPPEILDKAAGAIDTYKAGALAESPGVREALGEKATTEVWQLLFSLCQQIDGFPRHLGIHNGGVIVMGVPLATRVPTEPATMKNRFVVQWDKDSLEDAGLIKIDILGLRMLSAIAEAQEMIAEEGERPDLAGLSFDDAAIYEMITKADTVGVFQVESRAQAQVLPRLQPKNFNDIVVSISLIRPGPIQGNMVHPYLRRRLGQEPITYPHPLLEGALEETLGVVLFQETVLKVARDLAGFTAGKGEQLRRALGAKRATEAVERFRNAFLEGAQAKGVEETIASAVFDTLRAFGGYSFPKSHAAAFAVLVYQSAWLRYYHPEIFLIALLNSQPMGYWSPAVLVNDAKRRGITLLPVDVNLSDGICRLEGKAVRLGFNYVSGFGEVAIARLMEARQAGSFANLTDLCKRTQLPRRLVEHLILAGGMDQWGKTRRKLIWELVKIVYDESALALVYPEDEVDFPSVSPAEIFGVEYQMLGVSLRDHPMTFYRRTLQQRGVWGSRDLSARRDGEQVQIAGVVLIHQSPPTAKGFHFLTLEDQDGFMNVIVRPDVYARYRRIVRNSPLLIVEGELQRQGEVINIIAEAIRSVT